MLQSMGSQRVGYHLVTELKKMAFEQRPERMREKDMGNPGEIFKGKKWQE